MTTVVWVWNRRLTESHLPSSVSHTLSWPIPYLSFQLQNMLPLLQLKINATECGGHWFLCFPSRIQPKPTQSTVLTQEIGHWSLRQLWKFIVIVPLLVTFGMTFGIHSLYMHGGFFQSMSHSSPTNWWEQMQASLAAWRFPWRMTGVQVSLCKTNCVTSDLDGDWSQCTRKRMQIFKFDFYIL